MESTAGMMGSYRVGPGFFMASFFLALLLLAALMCLLPVFFVSLMQTALERLHLSPPFAFLAVVSIVIGSFLNVPVYRLERPGYVLEVRPPFPIPPFLVPTIRLPHELVIAVNLGGAGIPTTLAAWEALCVLTYYPDFAWAPLETTAVTALVCYLMARIIPGIGIALPALVPPLATLLATWAFLGWTGDEELRAAVAFIGGVWGTLIGADLCHLKKVLRSPVNFVSIGGAGTFDGIVLSGVVAAFLA
jgi:uncharacterized membrane protein